jgi:hypothetical protein
VDHVRRQGGVAQARWGREVDRAIDWLLAQEHQRFRLLQQNEASDWADIMPRSGYVLYSNALWYEVKQRYALADAEATHHHFNHLFDPFRRDLPEYHRARLLQHYARRGRRDPGLYLSFVNLAVVGDEGDVFGMCWRSSADLPTSRWVTASSRRWSPREPAIPGRYASCCTR